MNTAQFCPRTPEDFPDGDGKGLAAAAAVGLGGFEPERSRDGGPVEHVYETEAFS